MAVRRWPGSLEEQHLGPGVERSIAEDASIGRELQRTLRQRDANGDGFARRGGLGFEVVLVGHDDVALMWTRSEEGSGLQETAASSVAFSVWRTRSEPTVILS